MINKFLVIKGAEKKSAQAFSLNEFMQFQKGVITYFVIYLHPLTQWYYTQAEFVDQSKLREVLENNIINLTPEIEKYYLTISSELVDAINALLIPIEEHLKLDSSLLSKFKMNDNDALRLSNILRSTSSPYTSQAQLVANSQRTACNYLNQIELNESNGTSLVDIGVRAFIGWPALVLGAIADTKKNSHESFMQENYRKELDSYDEGVSKLDLLFNEHLAHVNDKCSSAFEKAFQSIQEFYHSIGLTPTQLEELELFYISRIPSLFEFKYLSGDVFDSIEPVLKDFLNDESIIKFKSAIREAA